MVDYILLYRYTIYCLSSHSLLYIWVVPTFLDHCKKVLLWLFMYMYLSQFSSVPQSCVTLWDPMACSTPGFPHHQHLELAQTHFHQVGDAIQPSHPLSSPSLPAFSLSQDQGLFKWVSSSHQVAKGLEFQFQHCPSNEYSGLISFRMDLFDLFAVQGTVKSLLQHHSSKHQFFSAQVSL